MMLRLNGEELAVQTIADLRARLVARHETPWTEVVLGEVDDPGESGIFFGLLMLTHDDRAVLLYFRYDGDAGLTSRDPAYAGPSDAMLDFRLSNGQVDTYPACWTIPLADGVRALEYAFLHRERAPWVTWNDESAQDGWQEWRARIAADGGDAS